MKGFCKQCGLWLNVHDDGKCHTCHYGHAEGRAFPTAATPEAVAREKGQGTGELVDVRFPPQTGDYADALRREADVARERAEQEPILGRLTGQGRETGERAIDRTGPEDIEEAAAAARANVAGMRRDAEQLIDPPPVSAIDPAEAGDADLKADLRRSDQGDEEAGKPPARRRGAATTTRDSGKAGK